MPSISYDVSPMLHRSLYRYSLKKFIESELDDQYEIVREEYNDIDLEDKLGFSRLLDRCLNDGKISIDSFTRFVIEELNYGRQRNLYISLLMDCSFLNNRDLVLRKINNLLLGSNTVNELPYYNGVLDGVVGEERLILADLIEEDDNIQAIRLVFGKYINHEGEECNNYISIEINLQLNLLVIKLRNWKDENNPTLHLDELAESYKMKIKAAFNLNIPLMTSSTQRLVKRMTVDLTEGVLAPTRQFIDSKIKAEVNAKADEWLKKLSNIEFTSTDIESLRDTIMNNYYRLYVHNEIGKLNHKQLLETYNVKGYLVNVKFTDDTIGEARAKSATTTESLLDTSVYYDLKTRLDGSEKVKSVTIYWVDCPLEPHFGTTFNLEAQEKFKVIIKPNFFRKELNDHVLQKIGLYIRT